MKKCVLWSGRYVVKHAWDSQEHNFLVCQTRPIVETGGSGANDVFVSMFFHDEIGLIVHDSIKR